MPLAEIKVSYSSINQERVTVTNSKIVYDLLRNQWNPHTIEYQEELKVVLLNRANVILGVYELSKGGMSGTVVDIKMILAVALKCNASGIILGHNHPSGNVEPSEPDKILTKKLKDACAILELFLLDHIIISKTAYYSFADNGNL
ncbi:MAG: DNA repair protein [Pedobacter sp.]|nr:MAG: DNA repair protein [Pedobacter sp.]